MSSLKKAFEKLDHENNGIPALPSRDSMPVTASTVAVASNESRCLRLVADSTHAWELPWATFCGASFTAATSRNDALDCIELSFVHFETVLRGRHLANLMAGLHAMSLPEVRAVDKKFLGLPGIDGEPVVVSIEVKRAGS